MRKILFKDYKILSQNEHKKILEIRNKKDIRDASLNNEIIAFDTHLDWVKGLDLSQYFAVYADNDMIGGLNFTNSAWGLFFDDVDVFLKLVCAYAFLEEIFSKNEQILSYVKLENEKALNFNLTFDFKEQKRDEKMCYLMLKKSDFYALDSKIINRVKRLKNSFDITFATM